MILPDNPIDEKGKDLLKRWPLALKVAELIAKYQGDESIVIGIEGPWGAGKTSFVNLVLKELERSNASIVVHFNPWNFTGQNELLTDFFASLSHAVKNATGRNIFKSFKPYVSKLKVNVNPSISLLGAQLNLGEIWSNGEESLQEARKTIDTKLKALPKKIVIVLDDLDRLDKEETRLIMKLVKMTANFSKTVFVLAYDRDRVAERLDDDGWSGEEYLKKIIQVSFTLPTPGRQGLNSILFKDLDESIRAVYGEVKLEGEDEKHWEEVRYAGFDSLFKTVRDIKRYIGSLRLNWSIVSKEDVNKVDFIAIEAIRIFAPKFYSAISGNESFFAGKEASILRHLGKDESHRRNQYAELLKLVPEDIRPAIDAMTQKLFPSTDSSGSIGSDWQQAWRNQKRICAEERFGFYFELGVPDGAVSENDIKHLSSVMSDQTACSEVLLGFANDGRIRQVLVKVTDFVELHSVSEEQGKVLLSSLWSLESKIDDERKQVFDFDDAPTQTFRIGFRVFKHAVPRERRKDVLIELISKSENLYHPSRLLALFVEERERPENGEEPLFGLDDIKEIKKFFTKMVAQKAEDGTLSAYKEFVWLLYRWKEWAGVDVVKKYVTQLIRTEDGVIRYLKGYTGKVISTGGNYKSIDRKAIVDFISIEELQAVVDKIDVSKLEDDDAKEAIEIFRNPPKLGW